MIFWNKLAQKGGIFSIKRSNGHQYWILHIQISFCIKFHFEQTILPRRIFMVKNRKNEYHHWILHIRTSLTKFQLKLTNLIFWTKFTQKGFLVSLGTKFQLKLSVCLSQICLKMVFLVESRAGNSRTKSARFFCSKG